MVELFAGLVLYLVVGVGICAAALILGGPDERSGARGLLAAAIATEAASVLGGTHWQGANWLVLVVDLAFLAWLLRLICRSTRFWPIWAAAGQLAGVVAHLPAILIPDFSKRMYILSQPVWVIPILAALLVGTLKASSRRGKRGGTAAASRHPS